MSQAPDPEKLKNYLGLVFGSLGGAMTSAMICLGDRLGLYRALAGRESGNSAELAAATGLKERRLREWLYAQAAAGVLEHRGDERFALSSEGVAVLADEGHPAFGAGFFAHLPQTLAVVDKLPEAFRTGLGLPYDAFGPEGAAGIERGFAPWFRTMLVPFALPKLPGVADALRTGATAADVGCGAGVAVLEMAKAFPRSRLHARERTRPRPASRTRTSTMRAGSHSPRTRASTSSPPSTVSTTWRTPSACSPRCASRSGPTACS